MTPVLFTTDEVCKILNVSAVTLRRWVRQGKLTPVRITKRTVRFPVSEVAQLVSKNEVG